MPIPAIGLVLQSTMKNDLGNDCEKFSGTSKYHNAFLYKIQYTLDQNYQKHGILYLVLSGPGDNSV